MVSRADCSEADEGGMKERVVEGDNRPPPELLTDLAFFLSSTWQQ